MLIQIWYDLVDKFLHVPAMEYVFMKNALLALLILCPLFGMLGTMVVNKSMSFFSDSLGHSAFTGVAIGVILGIKDPIVSLILFGIVFALGIVYVKNKNAASNDTTIGVFSATAVALGIVLLSLRGGLNKYTSFLIGDLLSISPKDITRLSIALILVVIYWVFAYNKLVTLSINEPLAKSRRINQRLIETSFAILIAIIVMMSIQWVGMLLINAMLVLPAAAARNNAKTAKSYQIQSILFSSICGVVGLFFAYSSNTPPGATIILLLAAIYFVTLVFRNKKR